MDIKKSDLIKVVNKLDSQRKSDLCYGLIDALFDTAWDYDLDQMDSVLEVIENITGLDNLNVILYEE